MQNNKYLWDWAALKENTTIYSFLDDLHASDTLKDEKGLFLIWSVLKHLFFCYCAYTICSATKTQVATTQPRPVHSTVYEVTRGRPVECFYFLSLHYDYDIAVDRPPSLKQVLACQEEYCRLRWW